MKDSLVIENIGFKVWLEIDRKGAWMQAQDFLINSEGQVIGRRDDENQSYGVLDNTILFMYSKDVDVKGKTDE